MRRYLLRSYQSVLILKPDIEESRVADALEKIGDFIKSNGGAILKTENWGKKRLDIAENRVSGYLGTRVGGLLLLGAPRDSNLSWESSKKC